jgi:MazG family protein
MNLDEAANAFREFVSVVRALRTPETGCPWDLEQDHQTLRPYLIEEAHEVLDAIDHQDDRSLQDELGDLLLQIVLHAQLADDRGAFSITEVVRGISAKMVRRHPHVFGTVQVSGSDEVTRNWEQIKAAERQASGKPAEISPFARIPESLPALTRAQRLGEKAAQGEADRVLLDVVRQRLIGLEESLRLDAGSAPPTGEHRKQLQHGLGDLLFNLCQLARRFGLDAEESLRAGNRRFVDQFVSAGPSAPPL